MSTDELIRHIGLIGLTVKAKDGRPVLHGDKANVPESLLVLLRMRRKEICERLAISPDAPPLPTPGLPQPGRRIVLADTGEVLQEFEAKIGQPEQAMLAEWAAKHPGQTVAVEWRRVCPRRQTEEWVRWMTCCEEVVQHDGIV